MKQLIIVLILRLEAASAGARKFKVDLKGDKPADYPDLPYNPSFGTEVYIRYH
jgi:hypothetical protein